MKDPSIKLPDGTEILLQDIAMEAVRSQGAGGQNVNKVATAIHLRFDIRKADLPHALRTRLLERNDHRINSEGVLIIKAQEFTSQMQNRRAALQRLRDLLVEAATPIPSRRQTRPTLASQRRQQVLKLQRSRIKALRGKGGLSPSGD